MAALNLPRTGTSLVQVFVARSPAPRVEALERTIIQEDTAQPVGQRYGDIMDGLPVRGSLVDLIA